jgi:hypothetical protein
MVGVGEVVVSAAYVKVRGCGVVEVCEWSMTLGVGPAVDDGVLIRGLIFGDGGVV